MQPGLTKLIYIFDVDGTLTPPRSAMEPDFARSFVRFCQMNTVYLATGSDRSKLDAQLPETVSSAAAGIFTCGGSQFEAGGKLVYRHDHEFPDELIDWLDARVRQSTYPTQIGRHIEYRTGQLNVSTIGRAADATERKAYTLWDGVHKERARICTDLMLAFPDYEASSGGQISIDVSPVGWNKQRVLIPILERHGDVAITFVGDNVNPGGNDWALAEALHKASPHHCVVPVRNYLETEKFLELQSPVNQPLSA